MNMSAPSTPLPYLQDLKQIDFCFFRYINHATPYLLCFSHYQVLLPKKFAFIFFLLFNLPSLVLSPYLIFTFSSQYNQVTFSLSSYHINPSIFTYYFFLPFCTSKSHTFFTFTIHYLLLFFPLLFVATYPSYSFFLFFFFEDISTSLWVTREIHCTQSVHWTLMVLTLLRHTERAKRQKKNL